MNISDLKIILEQIQAVDGNLDIKMIQEDKIFTPIFEVRTMGDNKKHLIVGDRRKENR